MAASLFGTVLVPLDGSPHAAAALPAARTVATATGSALALLRVVPRSDQDTERREVREAERGLARIAQELIQAGLRVSHWVRFGEAPQVILETASELGAGLVVMATHGRSGVSRALMGSVSAGVLAQTRVPLLLLRPGGRRLTHLRRMLVPVDGSPGSALALGAAVDMARAAGAAMDLVEVVVPFPLWAMATDMYVPNAYDPAWDEEARVAAEGYVSSLAQRLQRSGVETTARVVEGVPAAAICQAAQDLDSDLVVMSTHAHTGPLRALLGSVADAVVRGAGRPVLLVRQTRTGSAPPEIAIARDQPTYAT